MRVPVCLYWLILSAMMCQLSSRWHVCVCVWVCCVSVRFLSVVTDRKFNIAGVFFFNLKINHPQNWKRYLGSPSGQVLSLSTVLGWSALQASFYFLIFFLYFPLNKMSFFIKFHQESPLNWRQSELFKRCYFYTFDVELISLPHYLISNGRMQCSHHSCRQHMISVSRIWARF